MKKYDPILDEIHAIRRKIEEETKDMTDSEVTEYYNKSGEASAKKYGFKVVSSANEKCETKFIPTDAEIIENAKI
jgi:predicted transcriptional regulator